MPLLALLNYNRNTLTRHPLKEYPTKAVTIQRIIANGVQRWSKPVIELIIYPFGGFNSISEYAEATGIRSSTAKKLSKKEREVETP